MNPKPTALDANKTKKELTLTWNDGHISTYSFSLLRAACPCAECRGGHENMGSTPDPEVFDTPITDIKGTRLKDVVATGSYGITIHPRPDERHIRYSDVYELSELLRKDYKGTGRRTF